MESDGDATGLVALERIYKTAVSAEWEGLMHQADTLLCFSESLDRPHHSDGYPSPLYRKKQTKKKFVRASQLQKIITPPIQMIQEVPPDGFDQQIEPHSSFWKAPLVFQVTFVSLGPILKAFSDERGDHDTWNETSILSCTTAEYCCDLFFRQHWQQLPKWIGERGGY